MAFSSENLPEPQTILSTAASIAATVNRVKTIVDGCAKLRNQFSDALDKLSRILSSRLTVVIEEFDGLTPNQMFDSVNVFLGAKLGAKLSRSIRRIKVHVPKKRVLQDEQGSLNVTVDKNQYMNDTFQGVQYNWVLQSRPLKGGGGGNASGRGAANPKSELRFYELSFHKSYKETALNEYLPYILKQARKIKELRRAARLHTVDYNRTDYWGSVILNHPAKFDTMAMDLEKKRELLEDLDLFVGRKDYYKRAGRVWKRVYLFHGPPGTGKSSLVAAMANYLKFDVYDLDLREVQCNSDLRRLLFGTKNRSILVIEDIDCNIGLQSRESDEETTDIVQEDDEKITLSALLNFIDGLWSSCGNERIIVFTTNHKDRLDPALLRPGRVDVELEMSYCTYDGFTILASNYLQIEEHRLFGDVEELLRNVRVTPAEVAGQLMKGNSVEVSLGSLIRQLQMKLNN